MGELKQISVFAENKPGRIEKITGVLADAGVNILAINIVSSGDFGVIKFVVDKCDEAFKSLKSAGLTVSLNEVLGIEMEDRPGGLHDVIGILTRNGINVENAHVFVAESRKKSYLLVEVKDVKVAEKLLAKGKISFYGGSQSGKKHTTGR